LLFPHSALPISTILVLKANFVSILPLLNQLSTMSSIPSQQTEVVSGVSGD
jgi:hypothetical protein